MNKLIVLLVLALVVLVCGCDTGKETCYLGCYDDRGYNPSLETCKNLNTDCKPIHLQECLALAREVYNMSNPSCDAFFKNCKCRNYIVDSPRQEIPKEKSIQIIPEKGHYEDPIEFIIIDNYGGV